LSEGVCVEFPNTREIPGTSWTKDPGVGRARFNRESVNLTLHEKSNARSAPTLKDKRRSTDASRTSVFAALSVSSIETASVIVAIRKHDVIAVPVTRKNKAAYKPPRQRFNPAYTRFNIFNILFFLYFFLAGAKAERLGWRAPAAGITVGPTFGVDHKARRLIDVPWARDLGENAPHT
jgi:hypothetical protein